MDRVKAIIFDFMGVLLFTKENLPANRIRDEIDAIIGKMTDDKEFQAKTMERYNFSEEDFNEMLSAIVYKYEKYQPLWNLLPRLRQRYKLAILNNGTALTLPELKKSHGIEENFDFFISSAIEGMRKPDVRIYLRTAERLKVRPAECLFMDDGLDNIEGAKQAGMKTLWWRNRKQGLNDFEVLLSINREKIK